MVVVSSIPSVRISHLIISGWEDRFSSIGPDVETEVEVESVWHELANKGMHGLVISRRFLGEVEEDHLICPEPNKEVEAHERQENGDRSRIQQCNEDKGKVASISLVNIEEVAFIQEIQIDLQDCATLHKLSLAPEKQLPYISKYNIDDVIGEQENEEGEPNEDVPFTRDVFESSIEHNTATLSRGSRFVNDGDVLEVQVDEEEEETHIHKL